jgi:hypothetical protein
MALSTTASRVQYLGDGSTTVFTITFEFPQDTDLQVFSTVIATGVSTTLVLNVDYTLLGAGIGTGGTITMTVAPANTVRITIARIVDLVQASVYNEDADFPVKVVEGDFDYSMMTLQQQQDLLNRSFQIPITDPTGTIINIPNSVERANKVLSFDGAGNVSATVDGGYYRGNYVPGTQYFFRDLFADQMTGDIYFTLITYVASSISADLAAGYISLLFAPGNYAVGNPFNIAQYSVTTGSANAYVISMLTNYTYNTAGAALTFTANFTNTGAATLNVNSLGAVAILGINGALTGGEIQQNRVYYVVFDGTNFNLINPSKSFGGGAYYLGTLANDPSATYLTFGQNFIATTSDGFALTNGQQIIFQIPTDAMAAPAVTHTLFYNKTPTTLTINGVATTLYSSYGTVLPTYSILAGETHSAVYDSTLNGLILLTKAARYSSKWTGAASYSGTLANVHFLTLVYDTFPVYSPTGFVIGDSIGYSNPFDGTIFTAPRAGFYHFSVALYGVTNAYLIVANTTTVLEWGSVANSTVSFLNTTTYLTKEQQVAVGSGNVSSSGTAAQSWICITEIL